MGELEKISREYDAKKMIREQICQLVLSFSIAAAVIGLGIILFLKVNPLFSMLCFYAVLYIIWWPIVLVVFLWAVRNPVHKVMIDVKEGTVTINDDIYKVYEDRVYITVESGVAKFLHYAVLTLNVTNEEGKRVATYFLGPVAGRYSAGVRSDLDFALPFVTTLLAFQGSIEGVRKEKEESVGTVRIDFPSASIRNTFYATGVLLFGIGDVALVFSYLPQSFYGNDSVIPGALVFMRYLAVIILILAFVLSINFFMCYRRLAKSVEVSWNKIIVNGNEFIFEDILRIAMKGAFEDPDNGGEGQAWLYIFTRGRIDKYYLGQIKNKKCFEPRRRLKAALAEYFKS